MRVGRPPKDYVAPDGRKLQRLRAELASLRAQEVSLVQRAAISREIDKLERAFDDHFRRTH